VSLELKIHKRLIAGFSEYEIDRLARRMAFAESGNLGPDELTPPTLRDAGHTEEALTYVAILSMTHSRAIRPSMTSATSAPATAIGPLLGPACHKSCPKP